MPERSMEDRMEEFVKEVRALRETTEAAQRLRGRRLLAGLVGFVLAVYTAISLHDLHVHHCMLAGQPDTRSERNICEWTIPWGHDHPMGFDPEFLDALRGALERSDP